MCVAVLLQGHSGYHVAPYMAPFDSPDNRVCCGAPQEVCDGHAAGDVYSHRYVMETIISLGCQVLCELQVTVCCQCNHCHQLARLKLIVAAIVGAAVAAVQPA
jgi:hypothetical protein